MAQWVRIPAALTEDLGSIPSMPCVIIMTDTQHQNLSQLKESGEATPAYLALVFGELTAIFEHVHHAGITMANRLS